MNLKNMIMCAVLVCSGQIVVAMETKEQPSLPAAMVDYLPKAAYYIRHQNYDQMCWRAPKVSWLEGSYSMQGLLYPTSDIVSSCKDPMHLDKTVIGALLSNPNLCYVDYLDADGKKLVTFPITNKRADFKDVGFNEECAKLLDPNCKVKVANVSFLPLGSQKFTLTFVDKHSGKLFEWNVKDLTLKKYIEMRDRLKQYFSFAGFDPATIKAECTQWRVPMDDASLKALMEKEEAPAPIAAPVITATGWDAVVKELKERLQARINNRK